MCRTLAHGGARCDRAVPLPGSPASNPERAVIRAEAVAEQARATFADEGAAALDRLFTAVTEATTPAERTGAVRAFLDSLSGVWHAVVRAIQRVHERRIEALDARFAAYLAGELAQVREARYAEELAALERLHAAELVLAEVELAARTPDWSDSLWRECRQADLETLGSELQAERDRLAALERRAARSAPDPRVLSDLRSTRARVRCWATTLARQQRTLDDLPRTEADAGAAVARAGADVEAARAATGLTDDEHNYITTPDLVAVIEHSRQHPEQRRARPVRA